ncbi:MAG: aminoglycoside 6-adenylyltransferase [Armatimonadota bacterium]
MDHGSSSVPFLLTRFVRWAETDPDVRAAFIIGARARTDHPADQWSDLDILVLSTNCERHLHTMDWVSVVGGPWIVTFIEETPCGSGRERRVLFEDGLDVDFAFFPPSILEQPLDADVVLRGITVLVDKCGAADRLPEVAKLPCPHEQPSEQQYLELVSDVLYHYLWAARKLRRGELSVAIGCVDGYLKNRLLTMVEWHTKAANGLQFDTWHRGRFLEEWADPRVVFGLRQAYAHYDSDDIRRALRATINLFRWVAEETAEMLGFSYPSQADRKVEELVKECLS